MSRPLVRSLILTMLITQAHAAPDVLGKTYVPQFRFDRQLVSLKFYVSSSQVVFLFIDSAGTKCGLHGSVARLGSTQTSTYTCNGTSTRTTFAPRLAGGELSMSEISSIRDQSGNPASSTHEVRIRIAGDRCEALLYRFYFKSRSVDFHGQAITGVPVSCQVFSGRH